MAVLNLNNMRDIENDKKNKKNTLVVSLGSSKSKNIPLHFNIYWYGFNFVVFRYKLSFN